MVDLERLEQTERCFHGPNWRWQFAEPAARRSWHPLAHRDKLVNELIRFRRLAEQQVALAERKYPRIAAAVHLWGQPELRQQLQVLSVADVPILEIADRLQVSADLIEMAELVFFDVRENLASPIWVVNRVIRPAAAQEERNYAAQLRVAYFGGPTAALAVLTANTRLPAEESERLYDASALLYAQMIETLHATLPASELLEISGRLLLQHEQLKLDREKLHFRVARWQERAAMARQRAPSEGLAPAEAVATRPEPAGTGPEGMAAA